MSENEKKLKSRLANLGDASRKGFEKARASILHSSHTVKLRLDVAALKKEKKRHLSDLGEDVYAAVKGGRLRSKLFAEDIANIDDLKARIDEKEKELAETGDVTKGVDGTFDKITKGREKSKED